MTNKQITSWPNTTGLKVKHNKDDQLHFRLEYMSSNMQNQFRVCILQSKRLVGMEFQMLCKRVQLFTGKSRRKGQFACFARVFSINPWSTMSVWDLSRTDLCWLGRAVLGHSMVFERVYRKKNTSCWFRQNWERQQGFPWEMFLDRYREAQKYSQLKLTMNISMQLIKVADSAYICRLRLEFTAIYKKPKGPETTHCLEALKRLHCY